MLKIHACVRDSIIRNETAVQLLNSVSFSEICLDTGPYHLSETYVLSAVHSKILLCPTKSRIRAFPYRYRI
jgi:hypothetical protein